MMKKRMNISGESIENFAKVFSLINKMYPRRIVNIENDNIIPLDQRTKLMFCNILYGCPTIREPKDLERYPSSYYFIYEPDEVFQHKSENAIRKLRRCIRENYSKNNLVFVQTEKPSRQFANSEIMLTEELVELLTMLYFRAKGYMVQSALKTYNGVDDVVIWRSELTEKLRKHGFIEYGCYVDELRFLRKLGKPKQVKKEEISNSEFIIIEAESSIYNAVKNHGGMNQLLGREWKWSQSKPEKYREGAKELSVANKLFITFPVNFPIRFPEAKCFKDIISEFNVNQKSKKKSGIICWETENFSIKDSDQFDHEHMDKEIKKYEDHVKQLLLENFYFDELLILMGKLDIHFTQKTKDEVFKEFNEKIQEKDADIIISELNKLLE